jgi:hypothetical protein
MSSWEVHDWHVDGDVLRAWVGGVGSADAAASVEQHVLRCRQCRDAVAAVVADNGGPPALPDLSLTWERVLDEVEVPAVSGLQRLLVRAGLSPADALLVAAAPSLRGAWLSALVGVVTFAVAAAVTRSVAGAAVFLMIAPLVPLGAVALAYSPETDPAFEQEAAAPYSAPRLILLRVVAVLTAALPVLLVAGVLLPGRSAVLWLVPAAAFTTVMLAASTWTGAGRTGAALAAAWVLAVAVAGYQQSPEALVAVRPLAAYVIVALAGTAVFVTRTHRVAEIRRS